MESDTQSTLAGNKFYKTSDHLLPKRENLLENGCESKSKLEPPAGVSSTPQLSNRYNRRQGLKRENILRQSS